MEPSSFLTPAQVLEAAGLHEGQSVADFGAGSGFFTRAAARAVGESGVVWAVDLERELLSRIKNLAQAEGLKNVEVLHGDAAALGGTNLPDGHFDLVIVSNLLFIVEDKPAVAAEAARVLKKGGRVLVVDWAESFGGLGPHAAHVVPQELAQKFFIDAGFGVPTAVPAGAYHWACILKKK